MRATIRRLSIGLLAAVVGANAFALTAWARTDQCGGDHGAYTDRLCQGDALAPSAYIISANLRYRLYYTDIGSAVIFDTHNEYDSQENWDAICVIRSSTDNPGHLVYHDSYYANQGFPFNYTIRDADDNIVQVTVANESTVYGNDALIMDDSGELLIFDDRGEIGTLEICQ